MINNQTHRRPFARATVDVLPLTLRIAFSVKRKRGVMNSCAFSALDSGLCLCHRKTLAGSSYYAQWRLCEPLQEDVPGSALR